MIIPEKSRPLNRVERAAALAAQARADLEAAIHEARQSGMSLRAIADASGFSVETVRQISQRKEGK